MNFKYLVLIFSILFGYHVVLGTEQVSTSETPKTFLYFAYGSNLKTERIHKNNPSATYKSIGKIANHRLDFILYSNNWHGSVATIVPTNNSEVWGVIWEMSIADMSNLDKQESVDEGTYFAKTVTAQTPSGENLECRTYQQTVNPKEYVQPDQMPVERQPSLAYMNTIIDGATKHGIPDYYVKYLKTFRHNNYEGHVDMP